MRYWVYINDKVDGPYEETNLVTVPGFTPDTLICSEEVASNGGQEWVKASSIFEFDEVPVDPAPVAPVAAAPVAAVAPAVANTVDTAALLSRLETLTQEVSHLQNQLSSMQTHLDQTLEENKKLAQQVSTPVHEQPLPEVHVAQPQMQIPEEEPLPEVELPVEEPLPQADLPAEEPLPQLDLPADEPLHDEVNLPTDQPVAAVLPEEQSVDEAGPEEELVLRSALDSLYGEKPISENVQEEAFQDLLPGREKETVADIADDLELIPVKEENSTVKEALITTPSADEAAKDALIEELTSSPKEDVIDQIIQEHQEEKKDSVVPGIAAGATAVAAAAGLAALAGTKEKSAETLEIAPDKENPFHLEEVLPSDQLPADVPAKKEEPILDLPELTPLPDEIQQDGALPPASTSQSDVIEELVPGATLDKENELEKREKADGFYLRPEEETPEEQKPSLDLDSVNESPALQEEPAPAEEVVTEEPVLNLEPVNEEPTVQEESASAEEATAQEPTTEPEPVNEEPAVQEEPAPVEEAVTEKPTVEPEPVQEEPASTEETAKEETKTLTQKDLEDAFGPLEDQPALKEDAQSSKGTAAVIGAGAIGAAALAALAAKQQEPEPQTLEETLEKTLSGSTQTMLSDNPNDLTEIELKEGSTYLISDFVPPAQMTDDFAQMLGVRKEDALQNTSFQDILATTGQTTRPLATKEGMPADLAATQINLENTIQAKRGASLDIKTVPMVHEPAQSNRLDMSGLNNDVNAQHDIKRATKGINAKMIAGILIGILLFIILYVLLGLMHLLPNAINVFGDKKATTQVEQPAEELLSQQPAQLQPQLPQEQGPKDDATADQEDALYRVQSFPLPNGFTLQQFIENKHAYAEPEQITWEVSESVEPDNYSILVKVPPENPQSFKTSYRFNYNMVSGLLDPTTSDAKNLLDQAYGNAPR